MTKSVEKAITAMRQEISNALGDSRMKSEALQIRLDTAHAEIERLQTELDGFYDDMNAGFRSGLAKDV